MEPLVTDQPGLRWLAPWTLSSPSVQVTAPSLGMAADGTAVAVWHRWDGTTSALQASWRPPGGPWASPVDLVTGPMWAGLAVNRAGDALVVWSRRAGSRSVLEARGRPPGGVWSAPALLHDAELDAHQGCIVALNGSGRAAVLWTHRPPAGFPRALFAMRQADGSWTAPFLLEERVLAAGVAIDDAGSVVALWVRELGSGRVVTASVRDAAGSWGSREALSGPGAVPAPQLRVDAAGNAIAAWVTPEATGTRVEVAERPAGGVWSRPQAISKQGLVVDAPELSMGADGDAIVAWRVGGADGAWMQAARRPAGTGVWQPAADVWRPLSRYDGVQALDVAMGRRGAAVAAWRLQDHNEKLTQVAVMAEGGSWGPVTTLSRAGQLGSGFAIGIAVDDAGDALALWDRHDGSSDLIEYAGGDGAGPILTPLAIAPTATAGTTSWYSVSSVDNWSLVDGDPVWDFGDGTPPEAGTQVSHTFAQPGTYALLITQRDVHGHRTTLESTIEATPP